MTQLLPTFGGVLSDRGAAGARRRRVGRATSSPACRCRSCRAACRSCSCRCATRAAVDASPIDRRALTRAASTNAGLDELPVFFFTPDDAAPATTRRSTAACSRRASASPKIPATGGASGPLGCYLLHHGWSRADTARQHDQPAGRRHGPPEPHPHVDRQRRRSDHAGAGRGERRCWWDEANSPRSADRDHGTIAKGRSSRRPRRIDQACHFPAFPAFAGSAAFAIVP